MTLTLTFTREKETPNTVRFSEDVEDGETAVVGTLYLKKSILEENGALDAESVTITVTAAPVTATKPELSLV